MSPQRALDLGLVVATHGRHLVIETPDGDRLLCHPRGKRREVVVGDRVRWQRTGDEGVVEHIEPRRNLLFRQDEWRTKSFAANVDQLLLLVAAVPVFGESQLTRALIAASAAGVPTIIGLNKVDLPEAAAARERLLPYRRMGLDVMELSLKGDAAASTRHLLERLEGRCTLLLGPSGCGKSTLVNLLVPGADAQVGSLSRALGSGRHTTTTTRWYWLDADHQASLIDSPGFQSFGLQHLAAVDLPARMPDFAAELGHCRFHNCTHRHEPQCGVRDAVQAGRISESRYRIYLELFDELSRTKW